MTRRDFLGGAFAAAARPLAERICLFTDHLGGTALDEAVDTLAALGVKGPDLTVRPGGLVSPERAPLDLPRAVEAFRKRGMDVPMISTAITSAEEGRPLLRAAVEAGIR